MGESQLDFHIARTHSQEFDEVWAINAMAGIIPNPDRVFAMDPMTRFFDTEDAGGQTALIRKTLSWLAKCMEQKIEVSIALRSNLLDANVEIKDKLYGYHRLNDPVVSYIENNKMKVCRYSEVIKQQMVPYGISGREDPETNFNDIVEPNKP